MVEIWKDISGYEGLYQVSNLGNVKSLSYNKTNVEKVLKLKTYWDGRKNVNLSNKGLIKTISVHSLVSNAFIGERPKGYAICHINGDYTDNRVDNLRYDIPKENSIDVYRQGKKNGNGKVTIEQVIEIRRLYSTDTCSQKELVIKFKMSKSQINKIINRKCFDYINNDGTIQDSRTAVI